MVTYQVTKIIELVSYLNVCASKDEFLGIFVFAMKRSGQILGTNYFNFLGQKKNKLNCTH